MTRARSSLVSLSDTPYYHCICRCVRRAFLCGEDAVSGRSFAHRRAWVRERLTLLTDVFAIDLCAYALMSNHYHLVVCVASERVHAWTDREVVDRWLRVFKGPELIHRYRRGDALAEGEDDAVARLIETWRERLGDLSWFMRCLNESIARQANAEDGCTGRFWEGRFKTQALLDSGALATAMAYVDLNPLRAGAAASLETSDDTSIQARLRETQRNPHAHAAGGFPPRLRPFQDSDHPAASDCLPYRFDDYVDLVRQASGRLSEQERSFVPGDAPRLLVALGIAANEWMATVVRLDRCFNVVIGAPSRLRRYARSKGRRWLRGVTAASKLYAAATASPALVAADPRFGR